MMRLKSGFRLMDNTEILQAIQLNGQKRKRSLNAWILLVISLFLFAGAGAFRWDLKYVILIVLAIFIHELGHLVAMRSYKYKNLKMLFIPFLGGVASGESEEQDAYKIAMISIAGPLIGLLSSIIAVIIWLFSKQNILLDYAKLSLIINTFNLLPIVPLDGGHFLNETLFSRFPKVELIFKIIAIIGLVVLAYKFEMWLLGILAFFMLSTLKVSYGMAMIASRLRKEGEILGGELTEEKIIKIRAEVRKVNSSLESEGNMQRLPNAINGVWVSINKTFPSIGKTMLLLIIYVVVSLGLPLFTMGFMQGAVNGPVRSLEADTAR